MTTTGGNPVQIKIQRCDIVGENMNKATVETRSPAITELERQRTLIPYLNKITCGDNCDLLGNLPRECIDMVVTSPPYDDLRTYGGHSWDFERLAAEMYRVLKPGGIAVWVVSDATIDGSETGSSFRQALHFKDVVGFRLHDTMIYAKDSFQKPNPNRYWSCFEYAFVLSKGKPVTYNMIADRINKQAGSVVRSKTVREQDGAVTHRKAVTIADFGKRRNIWEYSTGYGKGTTDKIAYQHPATFPEQLVKDHIISWSNPGDIVLDPFSGSGTTAKAARELNRQYIGFEINQVYCDIAEARLAQQQAILLP